MHIIVGCSPSTLSICFVGAFPRSDSLILLHFLLHQTPSAGRMSTNTTTMDFISAWRPEPTFRGTFSILSSCITTLILCVWTPVHINIPELQQKHERRWSDPRRWISINSLRKAGWMLCAILAPELVCDRLCFKTCSA